MDAAARQLAQRRGAAVTMAEVAAGCRLAKGTLYLYFSSKEELLLAVLGDQLRAWLDVLERELAEREAIDSRRFAEIVVLTLSQRDAFTELLPRMHSLLEACTDTPAQTAFTATTTVQMRSLGALLEAKLRLEAREGVRVLQRALALLIGLRSTSLAPLGLVEAPADVAATRETTDRELSESLAALVEAVRNGPQPTRRRPLSSELGVPELASITSATS